MTPGGLLPFLERHPAFGEWQEAWLGVPLHLRAGLSDEPPPVAFVGSVRAVVLRGAEVLVVRTPAPLLTVGGRREPGEALEQTLRREVAEETGWLVCPLGVIGFIHVRHLDGQRPAWGRPAPDFVDPVFAAVAEHFDGRRRSPGEAGGVFVPVERAERLGLSEVDRVFLRAALGKGWPE